MREREKERERIIKIFQLGFVWMPRHLYLKRRSVYGY